MNKVANIRSICFNLIDGSSVTENGDIIKTFITEDETYLIKNIFNFGTLAIILDGKYNKQIDETSLFYKLINTNLNYITISVEFENGSIENVSYIPPDNCCYEQSQLTVDGKLCLLYSDKPINIKDYFLIHKLCKEYKLTNY